LGIKVSTKPYKWNELTKLQHYRNAIAHHDGEVTLDNIRFLGPLGYKEGQSLEISFTELGESMQLVRETAMRLAKDFEIALETKGLS
jgi:hypothetical protein